MFPSLTWVVYDLYAVVSAILVSIYCARSWDCPTSCKVVPRLSLTQTTVANLFVQGKSLFFPYTSTARWSQVYTIIAESLWTAALVLRIWYTNRDTAMLRFGVVLSYVGTTIATGVLLKPVWREIAGTSPFNSDHALAQIFGCASGQSDDAWTIFIPNIVLHSIVYMATIAPAVREWYWGRKSALMHRILREWVTIFSLVSLSSHWHEFIAEASSSR